MALTHTQLLVLVTKLRPVIGKTLRLLLVQSVWNTGQPVQCPLNVFTGSSALTQHWEPFLFLIWQVSHNIPAPPVLHSVPTFPTLPHCSGLLVKSGGGWAGMSPCFLADESSVQQGKKQQVSSVPLVTFSALKNGRKHPGTC